MQDKLLVLSENQAITTSTESDFYIDAKAVSNPGTPFICEAVVGTAFAGGTSLMVSVEVGKDASFTDKKTLAASPAVDIADLKAGKQILVPIPYNFDKEYPNIRAYYTVDGTMTEGTITTVVQPRVWTNH